MWLHGLSKEPIELSIIFFAEISKERLVEEKFLRITVVAVEVPYSIAGASYTL